MRPFILIIGAVPRFLPHWVRENRLVMLWRLKIGERLRQRCHPASGWYSSRRRWGDLSPVCADDQAAGVSSLASQTASSSRPSRPCWTSTAERITDQGKEGSIKSGP